MKIYKRYIGADFAIDASKEGYINFSEEALDSESFLDLRSNYLCVKFTGNRTNPLLSVEWYKKYLALQRYIVNEGALDKPSGYYKNQAYSMLQLGFVPVGYCPSFAPEMTIEITRLLEQKHIPYVKTFVTSFVQPFYRGNDRDVWMSKMDGAELLGCSPEDVTSIKLFERIIADANVN